MKTIGRTLAILAAAMVVVGFWLAIGALTGSTAAASAVGGHDMGGNGMQSGFNLGGIVQLLPTLAVVGVVTAIVSPIQQRLLNKRRPSAAARGPKAVRPSA
jgi:hypothetical protein